MFQSQVYTTSVKAIDFDFEPNHKRALYRTDAARWKGLYHHFQYIVEFRTQNFVCVVK